MTLSMSTYLQWNDSRVAFEPPIAARIAVDRKTSSDSDPDGERLVPLEAAVNDLVWLPDIGVLHMRRHEPLLDVEMGIEKSIFVTSDPDLRLYQTFQSVYTINCPLDFSDFPFDRHTCYFEVS